MLWETDACFELASLTERFERSGDIQSRFQADGEGSRPPARSTKMSRQLELAKAPIEVAAFRAHLARPPPARMDRSGPQAHNHYTADATRQPVELTVSRCTMGTMNPRHSSAYQSSLIS